MPSKARLPGEAVRDLLAEAIEAAGDLSGLLEELGEDEDWRVWNLGGAAFGRPQFRGPGDYTAEEFAAAARHLRGRLIAVERSFDHRQAKEAELRERREARRDDA
jgi:hypothetical protein